MLFVVPNLSGGGAQFVASEWARYLAGVGDNVAVYTTHPKTEDSVPEGVLLLTAKTTGFLARTNELARYLRAQPVDVVVALLPYWNLMSLAAVRSLGSNRPKVVISGRNMAKGLKPVLGRSYARKQWLARRTYRLADLFIAISHPVAAEAIAEYRLSPDRVIVVPNPALAKLHNRQPGVPACGRIEDCIDIIVPARLVSQKRPLVALEVAALVAARSLKNVRLHFFGVGPLQDTIITNARDTRVEVIMHGWVDEWFNECPAGSVVLLASLAEGFANVLIEAAAAGFMSVVSSRCLGSADAVIPGITGELATSDSVDDYACAVLAVSNKRVGDVSEWLSRFSPEHSGGVLRDQLLRALSRRPMLGERGDR